MTISRIPCLDITVVAELKVKKDSNKMNEGTRFQKHILQEPFETVT
jgi:uncharacterized Zn ribbon protein